MHDVHTYMIMHSSSCEKASVSNSNCAYNKPIAGMLVGQVWHLHLSMDSYTEDSKILSNGHVIEHNYVFQHGSHSLRHTLCTNVCSARTYVLTRVCPRDP